MTRSTVFTRRIDGRRLSPSKTTSPGETGAFVSVLREYVQFGRVHSGRRGAEVGRQHVRVRFRFNRSVSRPDLTDFDWKLQKQIQSPVFRTPTTWRKSPTLSRNRSQSLEWSTECTTTRTVTFGWKYPVCLRRRRTTTSTTRCTCRNPPKWTSPPVPLRFSPPSAYRTTIGKLSSTWWQCFQGCLMQTKRRRGPGGRFRRIRTGEEGGEDGGVSRWID